MITLNPICKIGLTNKKPTERGERERLPTVMVAVNFCNAELSLLRPRSFGNGIAPGAKA